MVQFRHRSLKIRHKILSVTISDNVIYWASQIKSIDVFYKNVTDELNPWRFENITK